MVRLTEDDGRGNWSLKDLPWDSLCQGKIITADTYKKLCTALWKLKDYEESGLSPAEVKAMIELYDTTPPKRMPETIVDYIKNRIAEGESARES